MRRYATLIIAFVLCALPAPAALAQSSPFGPLPQAPPAPTATPAPVQNPGDQSSVSKPLLLGIAGGVAIIFLGIGIFITRDARRNLTESDRRAVGRGEVPKTDADRQREAQAAKRKARERGKRQRQARKAQRRR